VKYISKLASFLLAFGLAGTVMGQISKSGDGYLFRVRYLTGQTINFDTVTTNANKGGSTAGVKFKTPMTMKVLDVVKGVANLEVTMLPTIMVGNPTPVLPKNVVHVQLDERNQTLNKSVIPNHPVTYPSRPIKPGARWTAILPIKNPLTGSIDKMDGQYLFAGMQLVDGHTVAVVNYSLAGFARGQGTMKLLAKDGSMYSNEVLMSLNQAGSIESVRIVMTRKK
jgi:hypothetical protein